MHSALLLDALLVNALQLYRVMYIRILWRCRCVPTPAKLRAKISVYLIMLGVNIRSVWYTS